MTDRRHSAVRGRPYVVAVLVGALLVGAPPAAVALWVASTTAPPVAVQGGVLAQPVVTCQTRTNGGSHAFLTWTAVAGATQYTVAFRSATGPPTGATVIPATALPGFEARGALLGSLLTALLAGPIYAQVTATTGSWSSPVSSGTPIELSSVVGGLLGGVRCA